MPTVEPIPNSQPPKKPYTEWVSLRPWSETDGRFNNVIVNVSALWIKNADGSDFKDKEGRRMIVLSSSQGGHSAALKSEITDRSGVMVTVAKFVGPNAAGGTVLMV